MLQSSSDGPASADVAVVETAQNGGEKKTAGEGFHEMKVFDSFQALQQADQIVARCASVVQLKSSSGKKCARIVPKFTVIGGYGLWNWKAPRVLSISFCRPDPRHVFYRYIPVEPVDSASEGKHVIFARGRGDKSIIQINMSSMNPDLNDAIPIPCQVGARKADHHLPGLIQRDFPVQL